MHYFEGGPALSSHDLARLIDRINANGHRINSVDANYVYWLNADNLPADSLSDIATVLSAKQACCPGASSQSFWVFPRRGTVSPWSTQAMDILHCCGRDNFSHLEKGVYFTLNHDCDPGLLDDLSFLFDRMTQECVRHPADFVNWFDAPTSTPVSHYSLNDSDEGLAAVVCELGLVLSRGDREHLLGVYRALGREPTGAELMMFSQVNSEHCRHKIFNAAWEIDGAPQPKTLFGMIRHTHQENPGSVLVAYSDNAAVIKASAAHCWVPDYKTNEYQRFKDELGIVLKVETHNHPTGISPNPGAATGCGGEIRDESATGRGARPKMGLVGFAVSNLYIPGYEQAWEHPYETPSHLASACQIMLQAPIGAANFNNEFGRPALCGFFRVLGINHKANAIETFRGYHKPLMLAGGVGAIRVRHAKKQALSQGDALLVLGGPGFLIGLGGGAMSSQVLSESSSDLDFASVQRANPEMERRAQEFIDVCTGMGDNNPIISIHDVGAGGLCNALPELVDADGLGAQIDLRAIPVAEAGMSPLEIWCNESQERYVLAVSPDDVPMLEEIAKRERVPLAFVGVATKEPRLQVNDSLFNDLVIDLPMRDLFDVDQNMRCEDESFVPVCGVVDFSSVSIGEALERVLQHPSVADKSFLVSIGDRSVGGLVVRDQMVGPWQVPVADVAVTSSGFGERCGEAMAVGERPALALISPAAASRIALGEAFTNLLAAPIDALDSTMLSANWMSAADHPGEGAALYQAVNALAMELCPALGVCIPVGKDSLSMRSSWAVDGEQRSVVSPQTLALTACASVSDTSAVLTPFLGNSDEPSVLLLLDLSGGHMALGGSILNIVMDQPLGSACPDLRNPAQFKCFLQAMIGLHEESLLLAYHDRSDGGVVVAVAEMMFASRVGVDLTIVQGADPLSFLFNEELGVVLQVSESHLDTVLTLLDGHGLGSCVHRLGSLNDSSQLRILADNSCIYHDSLYSLGRHWSRLSYEMQSLRDNPVTAQSEYDRWLDESDPGMSESIFFPLDDTDRLFWLRESVTKPRVAILREQGVNGHHEMAAAFAHVGFSVVDVHMNDLLSGRQKLSSFVGLVACGGFSYGDVLGAGRGWAQVVLNNAHLRESFGDFFLDPRTFTLGVCNGCQMLSQLKELIPGADNWPQFTHNKSGRFEARFSQVKVRDSSSIFFKGMQDSVLTVVSSHGEGRVAFDSTVDAQAASTCLDYVDSRFAETEVYPFNPNGSANGQTAFCSADGRITMMMPHPERVFLADQLTWQQSKKTTESPWTRFFLNARL